MLMCRAESNYCIRKDKVMQLRARTEIQFANETIGEGGGRNYVRQKESNQANVTTSGRQG